MTIFEAFLELQTLLTEDFRTTPRHPFMIKIRDIVQKTLATGYLTVESENQLRQLLQTTKYGKEDLHAFMRLQQSVIAGCVKQESRQLVKAQNLCV